MREIKFRAWDKNLNLFTEEDVMVDSAGDLYYWCSNEAERWLEEAKHIEIQLYTGLKDKQTLTDIYEGDIIDMEGNIRGNIYESPEVYKALTTAVVAGMGYEDWETTKQRLVRQGKLVAEQSDLPQILRELGQCH